jgi:hypothetical protein
MQAFIKLTILGLAGLIALTAQAGEGRTAESGDAAAVELGGHAKYRFTGQTYPADSLYRQAFGDAAADHALEARLTLSATRFRWDVRADYQAIALHGDSLQLAERLTGVALPVAWVIDDDRRWWDLTHSFDEDGRDALLHRLDRLNIGFTTERTAWRFGRQAISWGNGLLFNPADVFNPFDPAAVDKEYKTGDDMLYGQVLLADGSDVQGVAVVRRDPVSGEVQREQSSLAFKYHGFLGPHEYDLLAAEHYDDPLLTAGGTVGLGGAIWRGDLTWTSTEHGGIVSLVTSLAYSWTWGGRNVSGILEYFHNGFGQAHGAYGPAELAQNPDLLARLARGELFTLGRNYLAAAATIEVTPLFLVTPTVLLNLHDPSALAQFVVRYDLGQELLLLGALNLPLGPAGSEYGGIATRSDGLYLSAGPSLFAQLAWYF